MRAARRPEAASNRCRCWARDVQGQRAAQRCLEVGGHARHPVAARPRCTVSRVSAPSGSISANCPASASRRLAGLQQQGLEVLAPTPSTCSPSLRSRLAGSGSRKAPAQFGHAAAHAAGQQVHRRRAGEAGHELRGRAVVDGLRRVELHLVAALQHADAVGQGHGLGLVVRHVDDGGAEALVQALDLGAHLVAQLGIEVGQRLVEQEHLAAGARWRGRWPRAGADRPRARAACAASRCSMLQQRRHFAHALLDLGLGGLAQAQAEGHVLEQALVRVERVVLEHHGDVAGARRAGR